jgi:CheY-like chemotaxis protein
MISIADSGSGIPEAVKPHLFEPYFTTKALGGGRGLGLAVCYGILKQSGGHIAFQSEVGRGTTFRVYLPRFQGGRSEGGRPAEAAGAASAPLKGTGVVLLVEENAALRAMAADVLKKDGYAVYRAANSREAISIAGRLARVDLLIADAAMADMTGRELAEWLCTLRPGLKALLTSTSEEPATAHRGSPGAGIEYLRKPYTPAILSTRAGAVLNGEAVMAGR